MLCFSLQFPKLMLMKLTLPARMKSEIAFRGYCVLTSFYNKKCLTMEDELLIISTLFARLERRPIAYMPTAET